MQFVEASNDGEVRILKMSRPRANALNLQMVDELNEAVHQAKMDDNVLALVLGSAQPQFFSAGFDVVEVFAYDAPTMQNFFAQFMNLYEGLLRFPKPVVGALSGHTFAGGAFLALALDVRVMADGKFGFALNEIDFAVILPRCVRRMLVNIVGAHEASRMILTGKRVNPREALDIGLVDEVTAESETVETATAYTHVLGEKPQEVYRFTKHALNRDLGHPTAPEYRETLDEFLKQWFSQECVELRRLVTASVKH